jgi:hypothetical protein
MDLLRSPENIRAMLQALSAGVRYFLVGFATGFLLGTLRVSVVAPALGPVASVVLELPVILAVAWVACGWLTRSVPATAGARLAMGGLAFALLIAAEILLGLALGRLPIEQLRDLATPAGLLGLAGQVAFGLFPLLRLRIERRP